MLTTKTQIFYDVVVKLFLFDNILEIEQINSEN